MSEEAAGVTELKDVLSLVVDLVDCAMIVGEDGTLDFGDVTHLWSVIEKLGPAFSGINKVPLELKDLSSKEVDELITFIMTELNAPPPKAKVFVEKSLRAIKACYEVYLAVGRTP